MDVRLTELKQASAGLAYLIPMLDKVSQKK